MGNRRNRHPRRSSESPRALPGAEDLKGLRDIVVELIEEGVREGRSEEAIQAVDALIRLIERLRDENNLKAIRLAKALRERFGKKGEKVDAHQLSLFLKSIDPEEKAAEADKAPTDEVRLELKALREAKTTGKRRRGRNPLPDDLPREVVTLEVPDAERRCGECAGERHTIGFSTSQVLEYIPASFKVIVYEREKVACRRCEGQLMTAPVADKVIESGLPGPGLLAHIAVSKYVEHTPIERLARRYKQQGVPLAPATLGQWVGVVADCLEPLYRALRTRLIASYVVGADDTGLNVLDTNAPANIRRGAIWAYVGYDSDGRATRVLFDYAPDRKGHHPRSFLEDRRGYIQGDGYQGLDRLFKGPAPPGCVKVGCMMHCRRYFKQALDAEDLRAAEPVDLIARLYSVEALATEKGLSTDERRALREMHSRPLMLALKAWTAKLRPNVEPSSPLGKALTYCVNQWDSLIVYLDDGAIPIDNGEVERRIRPVALGRKNWLFAGSDVGAQRAATLYSLMACCDLAGVEPLAWLTDILTRLSAGWPNARLDELLPEGWCPALPIDSAALSAA